MRHLLEILDQKKHFTITCQWENSACRWSMDFSLKHVFLVCDHASNVHNPHTTCMCAWTTKRRRCAGVAHSCLLYSFCQNASEEVEINFPPLVVSYVTFWKCTWLGKKVNWVCIEEGQTHEETKENEGSGNHQRQSNKNGWRSKLAQFSCNHATCSGKLLSNDLCGCWFSWITHHNSIQEILKCQKYFFVPSLMCYVSELVSSEADKNDVATTDLKFAWGNNLKLTSTHSPVFAITAQIRDSMVTFGSNPEIIARNTH